MKMNCWLDSLYAAQLYQTNKLHKYDSSILVKISYATLAASKVKF